MPPDHAVTLSMSSPGGKWSFGIFEYTMLFEFALSIHGTVLNSIAPLRIILGRMSMPRAMSGG